MVLVEIRCDTAAVTELDFLACEMQNSTVVQTLTMEKIVTEI